MPVYSIYIETPGGDEWEVTGNVAGGSKPDPEGDDPGSSPDVDLISVRLITAKSARTESTRTGGRPGVPPRTLDLNQFLLIMGDAGQAYIDESLTEAYADDMASEPDRGEDT